jgi:hypothetical protein
MNTTTQIDSRSSPETVTATNKNDLTYPDYNGMWMVTDDAKNPYLIAGDVVYVRLSTQKVGVCDRSDWDMLKTKRWCAAKGWGSTYYWSTRVKLPPPHVGVEMIQAQRLIIQAEKTTCIDHAGGDGLDNRRSNLRVATRSQNGANRTGININNTTGFFGVIRNKRSGTWVAQIHTIAGKSGYIGSFKTPQEAAMARDRKAIEYWDNRK